MVADRPPRTRKRVRLWPLAFLPVLGLVAGYYAGDPRIHSPFLGEPLYRPQAAALGTLIGCGLMIAAASAVLAYRASRSRFTIGAGLFTIAVLAVLFWVARMVVA
jgi:hypothetical protein